MLKIKIYTDGACSGNPGPGGWGALLMIDGEVNKRKKLTLKGGQVKATNNRMELLAVVESLEFVRNNLEHYGCKVDLYSDSSYVVKPINQDTLNKWMNNGWKTTKGTDVVSSDLWKRLYYLNKKLNLNVSWVKGHSKNKFNNYVDDIAVKECAKYKALAASLTT